MYLKCTDYRGVFIEGLELFSITCFGPRDSACLSIEVSVFQEVRISRFHCT